MIKAVYCTDTVGCKHRYHQDVLGSGAITVHHCPNCGAAGTMIIRPGELQTGAPAPGHFIRPRMPLPLLRLSVTLSLRLADPTDIGRLHLQAVSLGYTLIGFHGTGANYADSILQGVQDKSTTEARGKGFMIGSRYNGIPIIWANIAKGGGAPTVLRIYVRGWHGMIAGRDYDWGKMDPDDDISDTGLEMVLRISTFPNILALPSLSSADQQLILPIIWDDCPTHSFRRKELPMMIRVATHLNVTLSRLEEMIEDRDGGGLAQVERAFEQLHLSTAADSDSDSDD
jgi:hypothetical protein